jgi:hypothetical protein
VSALDEFLEQLSSYEGTRADRAALIAAAAKKLTGQSTLTVRQLCDYFERAHFARPNQTILMRALTSDRRVSVRQRTVRALADADALLEEKFPGLGATTDSAAALSADVHVSLRQTPLIDEAFVTDLEKMLELYAQLHTLENSMRRLIEKVLSDRLGPTWWDVAASAPMKRKHDDRLQKEKTRKWLPTRASLGPLYSLDWSDLITLMRKYESEFQPLIGEIDFLHRYADLGLIRHVVAHHGIIDEPDEFGRVKLALRDWQRQIGPALHRSAG